MKKLYRVTILLSTIILASCGGSGLDPIISFTSSVARVVVGSSITFSWESQNAIACTACGDWSGTRPLSGSEEITISFSGISTFVLTCDGEVSTLTIEGYRLLNGKVVDGYIRGASIFIDENEDFIEDSNEESAESVSYTHLTLPTKMIV